MRVYRTTDPLPASNTDQFHIYNGLDCCLTFEVFEAIEPQLDEVTRKTYQKAKALQAPVLEMELRGVLVDTVARDDQIQDLSRKILRLEEDLQEILTEGVGVKIENPLSTKQLIYLLYDVLGLPVQRSFKTKAPSVDRKALEKLRSYFYAAPILNTILAIRDLQKQRSFLRTSIDNDGRLRTSFNIAGTDTGRFSSYGSAFGTGSNLQNVAPDLRKVFIAEPGMKFAYIDLEQAESWAVAAIHWNLFGDPTYLNLIASGDLHTTLCRLCFEGLPWTGDLKKDKEIAKQPFYRTFSYRDAQKRLSHASSYFGKPPQISRETHIELALVQNFQKKFFKAIPSMEPWHNWVRQKLLKDGFLTTFMGRRRFFFGRRWEDETLRAAIAYEPQSAVADYLSDGILRVWRANICQVLLQIHDAILIQYPEELENKVVPAVQKLLQVEIPLMNGRTLTIPTEAFVGWNWSYAANDKKVIVNPNGLVPFTGADQRTRVQTESILNRKFSQA